MQTCNTVFDFCYSSLIFSSAVFDDLVLLDSEDEFLCFQERSRAEKKFCITICITVVLEIGSGAINANPALIQIVIQNFFSDLDRFLEIWIFSPKIARVIQTVIHIVIQN